MGDGLTLAKELAAHSLFVNTARMPWVAKFQRVWDEHGKEASLNKGILVDAAQIR
jgi:hypothetical protein